MVQNWLKLILVCSVAAMVLSCGHGQILQSITVRPPGAIFEGFEAAAQFTALGNYAYPTQTKDITNQVLWRLDAANFATVTQTGLVTYTRYDGCGGANLTATYYSNPNNPSAGTTVVGSAFLTGAKQGTAACQ